MSEPNVVKTKSFDFAVKCIHAYKLMIFEKEYALSKQFVRAATSIGANVEEAGAGISRKDFIAKMSIASKEARETNYWLRLFEATHLYDIDLSALKSDSEELIRLTTSIVKTSQRR